MKTRFEHRFVETDLTQRQWEPDTSIDTVLAELEKYKTYYDAEYVLFEDVFYRNWLYCAGCAPPDGLIFEWGELEKLLDIQKAGNIIDLWVLNDDPKKFTINCPNLDGLFPKKGAY
jgi:hypothetical protein